MVKSHAPNHKPPTKLCCSIFILSISGSIYLFWKKLRNALSKCPSTQSLTHPNRQEALIQDLASTVQGKIRDVPHGPTHLVRWSLVKILRTSRS
jgi:hypothetical protein